MTMIKRSIDVILSLAALICCAPLMLMVALAVLLADGHPILFWGKRVGRFGRPFNMVKFRSMIVNAENLGGGSIAKTDARVTRLGRFLRATKLDELPQFFNVLSGEMSLVGPRPELWKYAETFSGEARRLLKFRPGLTDWATLVDIDEGDLLIGTVNPDAEYERHIRPMKIALQLKYVECATLFTDFRILGYTAAKLLFRNWVPPELKRFRKSLELALSGR
jgi:lipopolysaccharide/colanic/teichoic acid biosynthesis glycosyltransferase